jgi:hypothetical protein
MWKKGVVCGKKYKIERFLVRRFTTTNTHVMIPFMDAYRLALEQARSELAGTQQKLKSLTLRVSQLESVVAQLEAITGDTGTPLIPSLPFQPPQQAIATTPIAPILDKVPLWKAIINALNGKKGNFTVPEAIAALERTGRHIISENRVNIVRNTLIQNKAFARIASGHYCVVGYEDRTNEKEATEATS